MNDENKMFRSRKDKIIIGFCAEKSSSKSLINPNPNFLVD